MIGQRWLPVGLVAGLGVGLLAFTAATAVPIASAKTSMCLVINPATNTSYSSLQAGVNAASSGQTLWVRGTCMGTTIVGESLTITGQSIPGFNGPVLNGDGSGPVVTVDGGVTVTINTLTITGGSAANGGGIANSGTLTLSNSTVAYNGTTGATSSDGGGIYNSGTLTLSGSTVVYNHTASGNDDGGGIFNAGKLTLSGSTTVEYNLAANGGGIANFGTVTMNDSSTVTHNFGTNGGGGFYNATDGTLLMNDNSSISRNNAANDGGMVNGGTLTMSGTSSIASNTTTGSAGGISNSGSATLGGSSSVLGNSAPNGVGGGIVNGDTGTVTLSGGFVDLNTAGYCGGIYNEGGTVNGADADPDPDANVSSNSAPQTYHVNLVS